MIINNIGTFFREVRQETAKVTWPTSNYAIKYGLIVIVASIITAIMLGGFDYIFTTLFRNFIL
ncbi:MAG: preprotein translocase subunit SecE [Candidatus Pacebacteria bacterium]|nr:preprotein translocase subunit SecE [Candidatus Paceibacterota bacterium]